MVSIMETLAPLIVWWIRASSQESTELEENTFVGT